MKCILAVDCGTTAIKASLIDMEGRTLARAKTDCRLFQPQTGWAEQDADELWEALCRSSRLCCEAIGEPISAVGIIFSAPWKHILPLDGEGRPLCRSMIWMDARAGKQAEELNRRMGSFVGTGQEYWPRLMWLREERPDIWQKARRIVGINTYFKLKATGTLTGEYSDDFIHTAHPAVQRRYDRILSCAGLSDALDKFPPVREATEQVGMLLPEAAARMGLTAGAPVFAGFSDLSAITVGTGCVCEGALHIYLGTSSWFCQMRRERRENYADLYFTLDRQHEGAAFTVQTGGMAYDWAVEQFYHAERSQIGDKIFSQVDEDVSQIPAGSDRLLATHWLHGELPPLAKNAKAVFFNITDHHDRRYFVRAIMESVCYAHRRAIETYAAAEGKQPESIRAAGGGADSAVWMQMLADVLQIKVEVPVHPRYAGTVGAYRCAMAGLRRESNLQESDAYVEIGHVYEPNRANAAVYQEMYEIYQELYPSLKGLYDRINGTC